MRKQQNNNHKPEGSIMFRKLISGLALLLAVTAAHAADYKILADRTVNFDAIKTFSVDKVTITRSSGAKVKQANYDRLRAAVVDRLTKKGLQENDKNPDVLVSVIGGVDAKLQPSETQGMPYFDGAWRVLPKATDEQPLDQPFQEAKYNQATLRIDIRNAKTKAVVWRALASDLVQLPVSEQKVTTVLEEAFKQYPPPPAQ
jgi:hypothetical protein